MQNLTKKKVFQIKPNKNLDQVLTNNLRDKQNLRSKAEFFKEEGMPFSSEQSLALFNSAFSQNFGNSERVISRSGHLESRNSPKINLFRSIYTNVSKSETYTNYQNKKNNNLTNEVNSIRTSSLEKPIKINKKDKELVLFKNKVIEIIKSNNENLRNKTENDQPILVNLYKSGKSPTSFFLQNKLKPAKKNEWCTQIENEKE